MSFLLSGDWFVKEVVPSFNSGIKAPKSTDAQSSNTLLTKTDIAFSKLDKAFKINVPNCISNTQGRKKTPRQIFMVIIWDCILNKHPARISIGRHNKTLYTVRTPKVGHFIRDTKRFDIRNGWHTELDQSGTPFGELSRLGSTSDELGYSPQVNLCFRRKAYIAIYSCVMLMTCISCVSVN